MQCVSVVYVYLSVSVFNSILSYSFREEPMGEEQINYIRAKLNFFCHLNTMGVNLQPHHRNLEISIEMAILKQKYKM